MIASQRCGNAVKALQAMLTKKPWLCQIAQINGPPLTRMTCVARRPWSTMIYALPNGKIKQTAECLIDGVLVDISGSDYHSWFAIDKELLTTLSCNARSDDEALLQLWLSTMIWGNARTNNAPDKIAYILSSCSSFDLLTERLTSGLLAVDNDNLESAYGSCYRGCGQIPGIGPSFFTKWLWALSLGTGKLTVQPCIKDFRVDSARKQLGSHWLLQSRGSAQRYIEYCELLQAVAAVMGHGWSAEKLEYLLYSSVG